MSYVQLTTPLVLHADPVLDGHAVTKRYVDGKKSGLDASAFTEGVISVERLPGLTGDVTSVAGTNVLTLSDTAVSEGSYAKVTVDAAGRVVGGSGLVAGDITEVAWSKVTTGKPTTAAGYGITNLIPLSGGTVSGAISSTATATDGLHAVTKGYVDSIVTGVVSGSLDTGDIIRKPLEYGPSGFLRCNGGDLSKSVYAALYAVVGEKYDGTYSVVDPNNFRLPNFSELEKDGVNYFIKY